MDGIYQELIDELKIVQQELMAAGDDRRGVVIYEARTVLERMQEEAEDVAYIKA